MTNRGRPVSLCAAVVLVATTACGSSASEPSGVKSQASAAFTLTGEKTQGGWLRGKVPAGTGSLTFNGKPIPFAPDGGFFAAFDRDAGTSALLVARLGDGREVRQPLTVSPRAWKIEHVAVGPRPGAVPSEEYRIRREAELARINAARANDTGSQGWRQRFTWPVKGRISGNFGSQRIYRGTPGSYHSGTDIATGESGTLFTAPADGVVILAAASPFTLEGRLRQHWHRPALGRNVDLMLYGMLRAEWESLEPLPARA